MRHLGLVQVGDLSTKCACSQINTNTTSSRWQLRTTHAVQSGDGQESVGECMPLSLQHLAVH